MSHLLCLARVTPCMRLAAAACLQGVLRELRACRCRGLTQLVLQMPGRHPLASLDLSGCAFLRLVELALPALATLNLSGCRTLYRLRMR